MKLIIVILFLLILTTQSYAAQWMSDDFESYSDGTSCDNIDNATSSNGSYWNGCSDEFPNDYIDISDNIAHSGTKSLRNFCKQSSGDADNGEEMKFAFGSAQTELYMRFYIYFPDGTEAWGENKYQHIEPNGVNNRKLFYIWATTYGTGSFGGEWESCQESGGCDGEASDISRMKPKGPIDGCVGGTTSLANNAYQIEDEVLGQWLCMEFHIKPDSGAGDGIWQMWVNEVLVYSKTNVTTPSAPCSTRNFTNGYLWGWSNAGFEADTNVYIDDIVFSDSYIGPTGDSTPPTITAASANGTTVSITTDETTVWTGYDANDCNLDGQYHTDNGLSSPSGSGTSWTLTAQYPITAGETVNLDCTLGTDDIEDAAGNDMVTFSDTNVTNNTAQSPQVSGSFGYGVQVH